MTTDQSGCENGYAGENGNRRNRFNLPPTLFNPNEENAECNYTSSFNW